MVVSDASGHWGCGAYSGPQWFQLYWEGSGMEEQPIMVKELIPIVVAAAVWGAGWAGKVVECKCDNQAVVAVVSSCTSKNSAVLHLLRCLFFFEAHFSCSICATYLPGRENDLADDLSRNRLPSFLQKLPHMPRQPCGVPQELRDLLFNPLDWMSPLWRSRFSNTLKRM